ncbi:MAG: ABC transporter ATP-binding protein [Tissierellia bacterium]|nr:ABC transporter ATP-binding protein [Tissierellia bacterium]
MIANFKKIIRVISKTRLHLLKLIIINILLALSTVSVSLVLEKLINYSINRGYLVNKFILFFIILQICSCMFKVVQKILIDIFSALFKKDISKRILKKYQNDHLFDHEIQKKNQRVYLLTQRVDEFTRFLNNNLIDLTYTPIYFIFTFIAMIIVDYKVSLIIIPIICIGVFLDIYFSNALIVSSEKVYEMENKLINFEKEMVFKKSLVMKTDIRDYIKSLNQKKTDKWIDASNHLIRRSQISYMPALINEYMPQISLCAITVIRYFLGYKMNYGEFMALLTLTHNVSLPLAHCLRAYTSLRSKRPIISEIERNISFDKKQDQKIESKNSSVLSMNNVSIGYNDIILKDLNLNVKKGEIIAISGESGSGKSSILKNILGIYPVKKGQLRLFGLDPFRYQKEVFKKISYVDNENYLFNEDVLFNITMKKDNDKNDFKKARDLLDYLNLEEISLDRVINEDKDNLSGGQKLKISLARAIFKNPDLIILDEPTASLDKKSEEKIIQLLKSLKKSIIITSHRQETLDIADHIYQLKDKSLRRMK